MPRINGSVPSLTQGVSQQPPSLRLPTQCDEMENAVASVADGLSKRPPTQHVAKLSGNNYVKPFVHYVNRDSNEKYIMLFYPDHVEVIDENGQTYEVVAPDDIDFGYLAGDQHYRNIKCLTISDTTFVLNRGIVTALTEAATPSRNKEALIWIRAGSYKTTYTVKLAGTTVTFETDDTDAATIQTTNIAEELATDLDAVTGFTITRFGNVIHIVNDDDILFTLTSSDDNGDRNHSLIQNTVTRFSDLPPSAPNGFTVKVQGDTSTGSDDYWVKFETTNGISFGPGLWIECAAPESSYAFDLTTMPHQLRRRVSSGGNIYFQWNQIAWSERGAGDDTTLPAPSFVGRRLDDLFLHRNRLGVLSQASVVMTQANNLTNFWRQSALSLLDDDRIDIEVAHTKAITFRHAVNHNEDLVLFGDHVQAVLKGGELLSPRTVSATVATAYASHVHCVPRNAETVVFFPYDNGDFTGVREYYYDGQAQKRDANTVTEHCPRYIAGSMLSIVVSPIANTIYCLTDADRNTVWVYQWFWQGNDKVQSAWHKWTLGERTTILSLGFLGDELYAVCVYNDGTYLEKINVAPNSSDANQAFTTHLDRRISEANATSVSYNALTDQTRIVFPFILDGLEDWVAVTRGTSNAGYIEARRTRTLEFGTNYIVVDGDLSDGFFAGRVYSFRYRFSPVYIRSQSQLGGVTTVEEGRLQVLDWKVNYVNTGYFRVEVTPHHRDTTEYLMTGQVVLSPVLGTGLGHPQLRSGTKSAMICTRNTEVTIDIINDTHMPSCFSSAEWVADWTPKAKRI